jgi:hypothetical protein
MKRCERDLWHDLMKLSRKYRRPVLITFVPKTGEWAGSMMDIWTPLLTVYAKTREGALRRLVKAIKIYRGEENMN